MKMRPRDKSPSRDFSLLLSSSNDYEDRRIYFVSVNIYVKPERRQNFLAAIKVNEIGTLSSEPAAVSYKWGENTEIPNLFHFQEQFIGLSGFKAHQESSHFAVWKKFAEVAGPESPFTRPPEVYTFTRVFE